VLVSSRWSRRTFALRRKVSSVKLSPSAQARPTQALAETIRSSLTVWSGAVAETSPEPEAVSEEVAAAWVPPSGRPKATTAPFSIRK
jgi:hypothetical protein